MQTEKAKALSNYFIELYSYFDRKSFFETFFNSRYLDNIKEQLNQSILQNYYDSFNEELKLNILEYKTCEIINDHLQIQFADCYSSVNEFDITTTRDIIKNGVDVLFLINLRKDLDEKFNTIITLANLNDDTYPHSRQLHEHVRGVIILNDFDYYMNSTKKIIDFPYETYKDQFNFSYLMVECQECETTQQKYRAVDERLTDFYHWQLQFDDYVYNEDCGSYRPLTNKYFSKFEDQCKLELQRLEKIMDYEKLNSPTPISTEQTASPFKWNSSDTDFLELFAALYQNESIVRADGKPLTRKEMQDYFQSILGLEIKDVEGKLTKAGNRNDNTAFLDALAQEFRNYVSGKEKKLKGRK